MAFNLDDAEQFAKDHKDEVENLIERRQGDTNQQQTGQGAESQARQGDMGGTGMQGDTQDDAMRDDTMGMHDQEGDRVRDEYTDAA